MPTISENDLSGLLSADRSLRLVEPHIYSVFTDLEATNDYDTRFGNIYDWVACNPVYNRLIWGYSITRFSSLTHEALRSSRKGIILDVGCGSLAFTAKEYLQYSDRPVVLMDMSLKMLHLAKSRLMQLNGEVPGNMIFLHADALRLPFQQKCFDTIISLNLLHCIKDTKQFLAGLTRVLKDDGRMHFTTLTKGGRFSDRYLSALESKGKLIARGMEEHSAIFRQLGLSMQYTTNGNMSFIEASE